MRALTVQQPWAWAIIHGGKLVENRTQAWSYRGPLVIHAGLRLNKLGVAPVLEFSEPPLVDIWMDEDRHPEQVYGAAIGVVDLVNVHDAIQIGGSVTPWADWCCHPWGEGAYPERHQGRWRQRTGIKHLVLENPRPLPVPIPARGRLGLWHDVDLFTEVRHQLRQVAR